jgi:hypothetical protein
MAFEEGSVQVDDHGVVERVCRAARSQVWWRGPLTQPMDDRKTRGGTESARKAARPTWDQATQRRS